LSVATREEMDALVIDFGGASGPEKWTWMGKRIGNVVRVWRSENQTGGIVRGEIDGKGGLLTTATQKANI